MSEHAPTPVLAENSQVMDPDLRGKYVAAKGAVKDLASEATKVAAGYAGEIKGRASEWVHGKQEVLHDQLDHTQAAVLTYVRKNPYKSIAIAAGAGLALGILLGRSR
ncbi:MAG: glycine zipper domain-containing protein [Phycisphaerae bacterium]